MRAGFWNQSAADVEIPQVARERMETLLLSDRSGLYSGFYFAYWTDL